MKKRYIKYDNLIRSKYLYILRVIESCKTEDQLVSCENWVGNISWISYNNMEKVIINYYLDLLHLILDNKFKRIDEKVKPLIGFKYGNRS